MTTGYSSTPLWKKLGYKTGTGAFVEGAPQSYLKELDLPAEIAVQWLRTAKPGIRFVHVFCREQAVLQQKLSRFRRELAPDGILWISWPKKASGQQTDITENIVRECALPLGFVDVKVCAIDDTWSGLKLMVRKSER